jgi:hypothetical protein
MRQGSASAKQHGEDIRTYLTSIASRRKKADEIGGLAFPLSIALAGSKPDAAWESAAFYPTGLTPPLS